MYVIEVIPLSKSGRVDTLTYYSGTPYETGTLISMPVRNQTIRGLVVAHRPVSAAKTAVRAATFSLKKLPEQTTATQIPPILVETARALSATVPATVGTILYALLPSEVKRGEVTLESTLPCHGSYETPAVSVLQATYAERIRSYRSRIREAFAHRGSVLLVAPTGVAVEQLSEALAHGIEDRLTVIHGGQSPKQRQKALAASQDLRQAKLIITTPTYAALDRHDCTHIIIEGCRSQHYVARTRPYLDTRAVLVAMAKLSGRHITMGDLLPRTEDEYHRREDYYQTEGEHPRRLAFKNSFQVAIASQTRLPSQPFQLIDDELSDLLLRTYKKRGRSFLYAARRGLAPIVTCRDCSYVFRCPDSGTPYSLLRTRAADGTEARWFLSSVSGRRVRAADTCPHCGSWRLREQGIGIQHAADELAERFPDIPIILFDHTTAKTARRARQLISTFYDTKGAILLGTAMAVPFIEKPVHVAAVLSMDATRSIPTWRADEEVLSLLLQLRDVTSDTVLVQTRQEPDDILRHAAEGTVDQFYDDELALRKQLHYPPYTTFVHLTLQGKDRAVATLETEAQSVLAPWDPRWYDAPTVATIKTRYALIRIPHSAWPDRALQQALQQLSPAIRIQINPARIV
jgi:primosomal protein N'